MWKTRVWCSRNKGGVEKEGFPKGEVVQGRRESTNKMVLILDGGKMLKVQEGFGDQKDAQGWNPGNVQGPWPVTSVTASREDFLPSHAAPAAILLHGRDAEPGRRQHQGGGANKQCEKTNWGKTCYTIGSKLNSSVQICHGLPLILSHSWLSPVFVLWWNVTQGLWLVSHCVKLHCWIPAKSKFLMLAHPEGPMVLLGTCKLIPRFSASSWLWMLYTVQAATEMHAFPKAPGFWN